MVKTFPSKNTAPSLGGQEFMIQTAMVLDGLPVPVQKIIEKNQENVEKIKEALQDPKVKLVGYFDKITDPEEQLNFTAQAIVEYFKQKKERPKMKRTVRVLNKEILIEIVKTMAEKSKDKIRLAFNEEDDSEKENKNARHFIKVNGSRLSPDLETYDLRVVINEGQALLEFTEMIFSIKTDFPESYNAAVVLLKPLGIKVFKDKKIVDSWNNLFE